MSSFRYLAKNGSVNVSANTPNAQENSRIFNKSMINGAVTTAFGWKCFGVNLSSAGFDYETINIATTFTPTEKDVYYRYFEGLCHISAIDGFFALDTRADGYIATVDEYSVFSFKMINGYKSLKEFSAGEKKELALGLYYAILKIIDDRKGSIVCNEEYLPLNCICEDNIYLSKGEDDTYYVKLLPMVNKSKMCEKSIGTDLYDAALVYFNLRYPDGEGFSEETDEIALVIEKSLSPLEYRQPSFEKLIESAEFVLAGRTEGFSLKTNPNPTPTPESKPKPTPKPNPNPIPDPNPSGSDKKEKIKKAFNTITGIFDKVINVVGELNNSSGEDDGTIEGK